MSRKKHCCCNNCSCNNYSCERNNCCGGLGSFPGLLYALGLGNSSFNSCSDNSLIMLLLLSSLMKR